MPLPPPVTSMHSDSPSTHVDGVSASPVAARAWQRQLATERDAVAPSTFTTARVQVIRIVLAATWQASGSGAYSTHPPRAVSNSELVRARVQA